MSVESSMKVVLMVGGKGQRLRPFTHVIPKPLLPVGDKPILHVTIDQLKRHGVNEIYLVTGYGKDLIKAYFQDGQKFGVTINYVEEEVPLGTAGGLAYLKGVIKEPFLLMNGDLLTSLNYSEFFKHHLESGSDLTVAVRKYMIEIPYGVVEMNGSKIIGISEKPQVFRYINAGIYSVSVEILDLVPMGRMDMTELIGKCLTLGRHVIPFVFEGEWFDIGMAEDYTQANKVSEGIFQ